MARWMAILRIANRWCQPLGVTDYKQTGLTRAPEFRKRPLLQPDRRPWTSAGYVHELNLSRCSQMCSYLVSVGQHPFMKAVAAQSRNQFQLET